MRKSTKMRREDQEAHVFLVPFNFQGHIKPMLCLAELLSHAGVAVTFLNSLHNHRLLSAAIEALSSRFPSLRFETIPDGYPDDLPRSSDTIDAVALSFMTSLHKLLPQLLLSFQTTRPVTAMITDYAMSLVTVDVAASFKIPAIVFQTSSAVSMWVVYHRIPKLRQDGQIPFKEEDMDKEVKGIPGLATTLRFRDLPATLRSQPDNPHFNYVMCLVEKVEKASGLILNSIQDIEDPIPSHIATLIPNTFSIGPLHLFSKSSLTSGSDHDEHSSSSSKASLCEEDRTCIAWLDSQPSKSVLYVSFGSCVSMTKEQLTDIWHGLNNSNKPFLWVIRADIVAEIPKELEVRTGGNGCIARWVNQEEVLAHRAVGGFLTHAGWNSVMEATVAGIPMICCPQDYDQPINAWWVSEVWKIGFDMKDKCDRVAIEKMVRDLMEDKREEIMTAMNEVSKMARESVQETGCSFKNFQKLVDYITSN